ncbi:YcaO-like family protein [Nocardia sp. NPDC051570]|uniref:YcaO-like family protein n=1 Tax=Nocardia sp. NPDC051570 TaxID=3364324 RepID=UPI0037B9FF17
MIGLGLGPIHVSHPFEQYAHLCFARVAARSATFTGVPRAAGPIEHGGDVLVGAAAGTAEPQVRIRARGELCERMSNVLAGRRAESCSPEISFVLLRRRGAPAIDPRAWPELSTVPDIRERPLVWVTGVSLADHREVLVPACAAFVRHRPPSGGPPPMSPGSAGLSAHRTVESARRHGLLEVLERDLFWRAWYDGAPRTILTSCETVPELDALGLVRTILLIPGPARTACIVVCLAEYTGCHQSFGLRATADDDELAIDSATEIATNEALMVRWSMRTPSARSSRHTLARTQSPRGPLQHAVHTFYRQDSLDHLLGPADRGSDDRPFRGDPVGAVRDHDLVGALGDHTGEDVVWVDTTIAGIAVESDQPATVGRVVAPGARRLPDHEEQIPSHPEARNRLPHPLG